MAASPYWKGFIRLSLVSVPVRAYKPSGDGAGEIHFNQLHAECHSRIQYKKTCPVHGEVRNDEIVSGFQYSKDKYVVIDPAELDKLRTQDDKAITISALSHRMPWIPST
jgi:DNA end-binding protein Ku